MADILHTEDRKMVEDHKTLLQKLDLWAFGNGVKGASQRIDDMEKNFQNMNTKLSVLIVITAVITLATIPDLLKLFGLL